MFVTYVAIIALVAINTIILQSTKTWIWRGRRTKDGGKKKHTVGQDVKHNVIMIQMVIR